MVPEQTLTARPRRFQSLASRYLLAIVITAAAALIQYALSQYLPPSINLFFYPAVVLSAWVGGFGPGALSATLAVPLTAYLCLEPIHSFRVESTRDTLDLGIFGIVALGLAYLTARTREATRRATAAQQKAEAVSRSKDQVLAIVSHDLRNPLHTIGLTADLIKLQGTPAEREHAARIRRSADRATHLVADLLDAAKIESGSLRLDVSRTQVDSLLQEAVSQFVPIAEARRVRLDVSIGARSWIDCDRERFLQVLSNLLANAVQYVAPQGDVHVSLDEHDHAVRLVVSDTGPGMTPGQLAHAFEPYWQGRTDVPGAGLGMFIARELVRAHGGQLDIVSDEKRGTTVTVLLPQPVAPADEQRGLFEPPRVTAR